MYNFSGVQAPDEFSGPAQKRLSSYPFFCTEICCIALFVLHILGFSVPSIILAYLLFICASSEGHGL